MENRSILGKAGGNLTRLVTLLSLLVVFQAGSSIIYGQSRVPFEKSNGMIIVPVHINRHGPFRFMVDTGTSACLIDESLARELALTPVSRVKMMSAAGTNELQAYRIGNLRLGDFEALNVLAVSVAGSSAVLADRKVRGVLGLSFLSRFNFLVDYKCRSIVFEPEVGDHSSNDGIFPMDRSEGLYVVLLPIGGEVARFVVDSGAGDILLFGTARIPLARVLSASSVRTLYGERQLTQAEISGLRIGKRILNKQRVMVLEGEGPRGCDGLLPANLFPSLYFDNRHGRLVISPAQPGGPALRLPMSIRANCDPYSW